MIPLEANDRTEPGVAHPPRHYSPALFVVTEVALAVWIRDNLSLNVLMLIYSIEVVKEWQAAGH